MIVRTWYKQIVYFMELNREERDYLITILREYLRNNKNTCSSAFARDLMEKIDEH